MKNISLMTRLSSNHHRRIFALLMVVTITLSLALTPQTARATDQMPFKASAASINLIAPNSPAKKNEVPINGSYATSIGGADPTGPGVFLLHITTIGRASHLGNFTGTIEELANFGSGTISGTDVFVAANGDKLPATHSGTFTFDPSTNIVEFEGDLTFNGTLGGTGRFTDATGTVHFTGVASLVTSTGHVEFSGTIEY